MLSWVNGGLARKPSTFGFIMTCFVLNWNSLTLFTALKRLRDSANANDVETGECAKQG